MGLGGAGWVKNFSMGICDGPSSTGHSSIDIYFSSNKEKARIQKLVDGSIAKLRREVEVNTKEDIYQIELF